EGSCGLRPMITRSRTRTPVRPARVAAQTHHEIPIPEAFRAQRCSGGLSRRHGTTDDAGPAQATNRAHRIRVDDTAAEGYSPPLWGHTPSTHAGRSTSPRFGVFSATMSGYPAWCWR